LYGKRGRIHALLNLREFYGVTPGRLVRPYLRIKADRIFRSAISSHREAVLVEDRLARFLGGSPAWQRKPGRDVLLFGAGPTGVRVFAPLLKRTARKVWLPPPAGPKWKLVGRLAQ